jgi:predicted SprT family Zn-dependent metalloprotease
MIKNITPEQHIKVRQRVNSVASIADKKYGTNLCDNIEIKCDVSGRVAGWAVGYRTIRLNKEAIISHWEALSGDIIPHEIAHLVCNNNKELGNNHDKGWKQVCIALGGDGKRTHDLPLTPARKARKFLYRLEDGTEFHVGITCHRRFKHRTYSMPAKRTKSGVKIYIDSVRHFVKEVG